MPYTATVLKVMVASPSDVRHERSLAQTIVHEWNATHSHDRRTVLLPIAWETNSAPAMGARAQDVINRQLVAGSDLLVAVFWARLGTPTGKAISGTVEEIEEHVRADKPVMLYFSNQPVRPDSIDEAQYHALREFKQSALGRGLVEEYDSIEQFREKFARQLAQTIVERFPARQPGQTEQDGTTTRSTLVTPLVDPLAIDDHGLLSQLDEHSRQLLNEVSRDRNGTILATDSFDGFSVETNEKNLVQPKDPRSEARGRAALRRLAALGLIEQRDSDGQIFTITDEGFRAVDLLVLPNQGAKNELLPLILELRLGVSSLAVQQANAEQIRNVTLWLDSDLDRLRTLAASFGSKPAALAAEAHRHLRVVGELARTVQQTPRMVGVEWNRFDWSRWSESIQGAERALLSLATEIEPNWRSMV